MFFSQELQEEGITINPILERETKYLMMGYLLSFLQVGVHPNKIKNLVPSLTLGGRVKHDIISPKRMAKKGVAAPKTRAAIHPIIT